MLDNLLKNFTYTVFICLIILTMNGCADKYFYYPDHVVYQTPRQYDLLYENINFYSKDNIKLNGWFISATGKPIGTIIHFHGNIKNITAHLKYVSWLPREGFNLFMFDYRGYGKSEGKPKKAGVYKDSIAAIQYIKSRRGLDPNKLFILGQSLGGAMALAVLGNNEIKEIQAVAIEATFYSYREIVRDEIDKMPVISILKWPLSFLRVSNKYSPGLVINKISPIPLLLIHGMLDPTISFKHSQKLYEHANKPKELWIIEDGKHVQAFTSYGEKYRKKLVNFFKAALKEN